jgi:hypothetical protein
VTLLLGGPRHGQDVDVPVQPQSLLDTAPGLQPPLLPPSYVDIASASTYVLRPFTYVTGHPLTGKPDKTYVLEIYVHETVTPPDAAALLADAVLRQWFIKEGALQPAQPVVTP